MIKLQCIKAPSYGVKVFEVGKMYEVKQYSFIKKKKVKPKTAGYMAIVTDLRNNQVKQKPFRIANKNIRCGDFEFKIFTGWVTSSV